MDESMTTPRLIHFEALRDISLGHVSDRIPIVMWEDRGENPDTNLAFTHADFMSIFVARVGEGTHFVEGVPFDVRAGDVYAMSIGMSHQ